MLPNVAGLASTRRQIFAYSLLIAPVGVLPWPLGYVSAGYGVVATALGAGFVWYAWKVPRHAGRRPGHEARQALFGYSLLYLFAIFAAYFAISSSPRLWPDDGDRGKRQDRRARA